MRWKRATLSAAAIAAVTAGAIVAPAPGDSAQAVTATLSKAAYLDKTLAGILGQVAGFLSGYEFHPTYGAQTMPDECFELTYGPYSGDAPLTCWTPHSYPGYDRLGAPHFEDNEVGSDDDYHIDFFIQHILDEHGPDVTFQDIKDEWVAHDVHDFGPGKIANDTMRQDNFYPPATGQAEYNRFFWLTEAYIETETVGMVAPGMPATARDLGERFGSVTNEFDSVEWAQLLATMYSLAYFETDARVVLHKAVDVLPRGGWPYAIYQKAVALHEQDPTDWRWAQGELMSFVRTVYQNDNALALPDRNNGALILSILYGENDYEDTLRIASLSGNDADCTAASVGGLMGILKGMAGTPSEVNDRIYQDGDGRYINDTETGFDPYIADDYPESQSWDDLAALYQANAEDQIVARGGSINSSDYTVVLQDVSPPVDVLINNYDFEHGSLGGWTKTVPGSDSGASNAQAVSNGSALSGQWHGTATTDSEVDEIRLSTDLRGLVNGATYRVEAFVRSGVPARLFVDSYGGGELYASVVGSTSVIDREWVLRSVEFTVSGSTARVGLHVPSGADGTASIDDVKVTRIDVPSTSRYEAESASRSGGEVRSSVSASGGQYVGGLDNVGDYVDFAVTVPSDGEYRLAINYANATNGFSSLDLRVNSAATARVPFPRSESWGVFSRNVALVPVKLAAGTNSIRLVRPSNGGYVEIDYVDVGRYPTPAYATISTNLLSNSSFESGGATQTPANWGTWAGSSGTSADADFTESGAFAGTLRLTHYKASAYEVYTSQQVTSIPNGTYTLTAWVVGGGGHSAAFLSAKNYGSGVPELTASVPGLGWPHWRKVSISGIVVTNGQIEVGLYSNSSASQWLSIDHVELTRQ